MKLVELSSLSHLPDFADHKAVFRFEEPSVGLKGFIAIHNENLGPATGGTRMYPYATEEDALRDVLRLSRAMTYKCALAGVRHGGGKAVIIADPEKNKNEEFLRAYARIVDELSGRFSTGEDVGITEDDVQIMLRESRNFNGRRGVAGDPSPYAALSTFYAMQVALTETLGVNEFFKVSVAIKGVGKCGGELLRLLAGAGASVSAADIKPQVIEAVRMKFPQIAIIPSEYIHKEDAMVFSPCALGNDITESTISEIHAKIICGAANNQLSSPEVGDELYAREIFYVPDYVANAGGLINVVDELEEGGYSRKRVLYRIERLKDTLRTIYLLARQKRQPLHRVADRLAEDIFQNGNNRKIVV